MIQHWTRSCLTPVLIAIVSRTILMGSLTLPVAVPLMKAPTATGQVQSPTPQEQLMALRRAIIGQESGTNFRAVNPHSGALGYGQIMPANLPSWTREALGRSVSAADFLNSPQVQLRVIDYKLAQYWQEAILTSRGDEAIAVRQVAARWYSGNPNRYNSFAPEYYNGHPYPSVGEYTLAVLQRYKQHRAIASAG